MRNDVAETIKARVTMREVAERSGLTLNRNGFCSCPFHAGDKTASFKVYGDNFCCYGCHVTGDIIKFYELLYGLKFLDAIIKLDDDFSLGLGLGRSRPLSEQRRSERKYSALVRERNELNALTQRAGELVDNLTGAWIAYDKASRDFPPDSDIYAVAVKRLPIIAHQLDEALGGEYNLCNMKK